MKHLFKPSAGPKMTTIGGSAPGILDDYAVRKDIKTIGGTIQKVPTANYDIANKAYVDSVAGAAGAPTDAKYIVQTANGVLTQEQALDILTTGLVKNTTGTGVLSIAVENTDYAAANKGVTNGDSHDHSGGDGATDSAYCSFKYRYKYSCTNRYAVTSSFGRCKRPSRRNINTDND